MLPHTLTPAQRSIIERPALGRVFLEGPAGAGKTTVGVEYVLRVMSHGVAQSPGGARRAVRGDSILVLVPQRTLAEPYYNALRHPGVMAGGMPQVVTIGGLAQRSIDLFWPVVAEQAGFRFPDQPPTFLTLETAQYYMARLVRPLLDQGFFESVTIQRNRLYSQIIDNLNKAAVVGFPHSEIAMRLKSAWTGELAQVRVYDDAQECAIRFRQYCLDHNLLDFSLQIELFRQYLWREPLCRAYWLNTCRHLVVDNLEEDVPITHDLLCEWLPDFESALLIYDLQAGYRSFLGADPRTNYGLREACSEQVCLSETFTNPPNLQALGEQLGRVLSADAKRGPAQLSLGLQGPLGGLSGRTLGEGRIQTSGNGGGRLQPGLELRMEEALRFSDQRFFPQMLSWVGDQVAALVHEQRVPPAEIAVLAPFLSDALRYSLSDCLERRGVPVRSHRPSRALREEPAAQCLLTLAQLAHPRWHSQAPGSNHTRGSPAVFDLAYALIQAIDELDLVRAQLLAEDAYRPGTQAPVLRAFDELRPAVQQRITFVLGRRYDELAAWLAEYAAGPEEELDYFFSRLFGEVLSQPGYGFHRNFKSGEVAANLVESARKFRWAVGGSLPEDGRSLGQEYVEMVRDGVVASQYILSWYNQPGEAVLLAPAYTFLMTNRPVDYQVWIDVGSRSWFERLDQPLTHPYVLSRHWPPGDIWNFDHEEEAGRHSLHRLALGLVRRCRKGIYLGLSQLGEQGFEQQGPLLKAIRRVLKEAAG